MANHEEIQPNRHGRGDLQRQFEDGLNYIERFVPRWGRGGILAFDNSHLDWIEAGTDSMIVIPFGEEMASLAAIDAAKALKEARIQQGCVPILWHPLRNPDDA